MLKETTNKSDTQIKETSNLIKVGKETIRVVSVFEGTKTSSELIYNAAVKKILYDN